MLFVLPELLCSVYVVCWLHKAPKWTLLELWEPHVLNAAWSMSQQQNMTRVMAGRRYANMWNRVKYFNSHFRMPGSIRFRSPTPPQLPPVPPPSLVVLINVFIHNIGAVRASYVCSMAALSISICHSAWNLCVWVRHVYKLSDANELCYGSFCVENRKLHIYVVVVVVWMRATKIEKW